MNECRRESCRKRFLVFGGGGTSAVSGLGAIEALCDHVYSGRRDVMRDSVEGVAGCSAGALCAVIVATGTDPKSFLRFPGLYESSSIAPAPDASLFFSKFGFDSGEALVTLLTRVLRLIGVSEHCTLSSFFNLTRKPVFIAASDMGRLKRVFLSHESHPDLTLMDALYRSMTIPFVFVPQRDEKGTLWLDGQLFDPIPYDNFPASETLYLTFDTVPDSGGGCESEESVFRVEGVQDFLKAYVMCSMTNSFPIKLEKFKREGGSVLLCNTNEGFSCDTNLVVDEGQCQKRFMLGYSYAVDKLFPGFSDVIHRTVTLCTLLISEQRLASTEGETSVSESAGNSGD